MWPIDALARRRAPPGAGAAPYATPPLGTIHQSFVPHLPLHSNPTSASQNAASFDPQDKESIMAAIEQSVGALGLNTLIFSQLTGWVMRTAKQAVDKAKDLSHPQGSLVIGLVAASNLLCRRMSLACVGTLQAR